MIIKYYDPIQKDIEKDVLKEITSAEKKISGLHLLAINTTYTPPEQVFELGDVIIIVLEESTDNNTDVIIIHKSLIISPKRFRKRKDD